MGAESEGNLVTCACGEREGGGVTEREEGWKQVLRMGERGAGGGGR